MLTLRKALDRGAALANARRPRRTRPRVVFISGEPDSPGHRYRVLDVAAALPSQSFETVVIRADELGVRIREVARASVLWIWRSPRWQAFVDAVGIARRAGARIVYDVDDLVFLPELAKPDVLDALRTLDVSPDVLAEAFDSVRKALLEAEHCTVSTESLAREARRLGLPVTVVPNGFNDQFLRYARAAAVECSAAEDEVVRIGYAAGTFTHQKDLAVAVPALARILGAHPVVRFVTFEKAVDVSEYPELEPVRDQIELRPLVPFAELAAEYARFDVNIAPLEVGNPFCEAKSELKYFEAALCGAPTVASPTEPFASAIRHGETGLLADDDASWYDALSALVTDAGLRKQIAEKARSEVLVRYGPDRRTWIVAGVVKNLLASGPPVPTS